MLEYASEVLVRTTLKIMPKAKGVICIALTLFDGNMPMPGLERMYRSPKVTVKWKAAKATWTWRRDSFSNIRLFVKTYLCLSDSVRAQADFTVLQLQQLRWY